MSQVSFVPKSSFLLFDRQYCIESVSESDTKTTLSIVGPEGIVSCKSLDYLVHQHAQGNLRACDSSTARPMHPFAPISIAHPLAADLPPKDFEIGQGKSALLRAIREEGGFLRGNSVFWKACYPGLCVRLGFDSAPHRSTINRWVKKLIGNAQVPLEVVLTPLHRLRGGAGQVRVCEQVLGIMQQCVEDVYLSNPSASLRHCHIELVSRIAQENKWLAEDAKFKCPGYGQLRRYVFGLPAYEVHASRNGKDAAEIHFRSTRYVRRKLKRALQRVEIDHTPIDVFLVDENGVFLGRARLTIVIDVLTRAILGFSIGYDGTSVIAVMEALRHAVLAKTYVKERYPDILNEWPMHGVFEFLAMDNGSEFHSAAFRMIVKDMGIASDMGYMPRKRSWFKGTVEALQKYLNRDAGDLQPGATSSHHWQRNKERPPEQYAVHTLQSITELIHIWICDVYHVKIHRGLKNSALQAWRERTSLMPVRLPGSAERMELACTELVDRKIQLYGVEVCEVRAFNSERLQQIRRIHQHKDSVKVQVRFKPRLLDNIWVRDPDSDEWFEIENADWQTRDKSQYQLQEMNRIVRLAATDEKLVLSLADAYQRMRAVGNALLAAKTIAQRKRALKLLGLIPHLDPHVPSVTQPAPGKRAKPGRRKPTAAKPEIVVPTPVIDRSASKIVQEATDINAQVAHTPFRVIGGPTGRSHV